MSKIDILAKPVTFKGGLSAPKSVLRLNSFIRSSSFFLLVILLPNLSRVLKSAMTERLCTYSETDLGERGKPTPEYLRLYKLWGEGQIGIIVLGNIPIHRENLEAKGNAIIDKDSPWDPVEAFKPVIAAAKAHGSLVIGQLTHGGRQTATEVNPNPVSSSESKCPDNFGMTFSKARALTVEEIKDLVDRWAFGAEVLYKAGAHGAQLHCAHGYLLSQFLSPHVNRRTDAYGGSFENRSRIIFEIISEIKKRVTDPKFIVSIKYNSHDFIEGGFSVEDSQRMAKQMEAAGVELIELSGGTYENLPFEEKKDSTKRREGFFIEFAERLRPHLTGESVLAVTGGFRTLAGMTDALSSSDRICDVVGLARPLVPEPHLIADIISGKTDKAKENKIPAELQIPAAYAILKEIGDGLPPADLSDDDSASRISALVKGLPYKMK
ncbi:uncharacterized protein MELLADRAFT_33909 [Melampsora larici-populina 98AG31]|uniref:NADH:flavin oxidoreductase/NADH oxidase N-terminal domain-containing protein n=1 Tax=Melampsora larici-populina (strain 98AG31 / pathotype 3-4-7) TaxID=747676 RepID=F4RBB7_MELLP|nr:uncharacterized protein MELLADRAFT_33909 [Melampsora larici-populina 98AG31]EGG10388.1 hypothetical protein MELLADRAFT_33909 [Melampsora larici-populina 98AG31]